MHADLKDTDLRDTDLNFDRRGMRMPWVCLCMPYIMKSNGFAKRTKWNLRCLLKRKMKSDCGSPGSIWLENMGNKGACDACNPAVPMSKVDESRWTCNKGDVSMNKDNNNFDPRTCMSWSTKGACEFKQKDLRALQVDMKSSGCNGLWVAPLWMTPENWAVPQHGTGEVDFFERGCSTKDGYLTSFGESEQYIVNNSWEEENTPNVETSLTAYMTFDPTADKVDIYKCPLGSNPLEDGTKKCTKTATHLGYYKDTAGQTKQHTEYMHLVTDLWNKCGSLGCSSGASMSSTDCSFEVMNLKMQFTDDSTREGSPFRDKKPQCDDIWFKNKSDCGSA
jgi:hypothetical protein